MNRKNHNWRKWHTVWVEHDPQVKIDHGCQIHNNIEEENNHEIKGYAQALKSIIIDLNQEW